MAEWPRATLIQPKGERHQKLVASILQYFPSPLVIADLAGGAAIELLVALCGDVKGRAEASISNTSISVVLFSAPCTLIMAYLMIER